MAGAGSSESASRDSRGGCVLLVDDDVPFLRALARYLAGREYAIETCSQASDAIERVRRGGVETVVSDISMPAMTGLELLRAIREHEPDLPVVLVTGLPALESATEAIEYGALKYLIKPIDPDALRRTVDQAVQLYRLARMKRETLALLGMAAGASDRAGVEAGFERALGSLWVALQPILRSGDGSVYGYEALLRTEEPSLSTPTEVLGVAERLGQLERLGRVVRECAARPVSGIADAAVLFVNLHPGDLLDPELRAESSALARIAHRVVLDTLIDLGCDLLQGYLFARPGRAIPEAHW